MSVSCPKDDGSDEGAEEDREANNRQHTAPQLKGVEIIPLSGHRHVAP